MDYTLSKTVDYSFESSLTKAAEALKAEGFGVLTEIDVQKTLKNKLDVAFEKYMILGACDPPSAYEALKCENDVGTMLPCNVVVRELKNGRVKIAAVHPEASMMAIENKALIPILKDVKRKLERVLDRI